MCVQFPSPQSKDCTGVSLAEVYLKHHTWGFADHTLVHNPLLLYLLACTDCLVAAMLLLGKYRTKIRCNAYPALQPSHIDRWQATDLASSPLQVQIMRQPAHAYRAPEHPDKLPNVLATVLVVRNLQL